MHGVLADPAVWAEPPLDLQERVVDAIAEEAGAGRRRRRIRYSLVAAAAAVVVAVGLTVGVQVTRDEPAQFAASLTGTRLAPDAAGNVTLTKTRSGWKIELHATGLPRRTNGNFYEAWLKSDAGSSRSDRHVQRGHRRHALVRRTPEHVPNADRHQGSRRRQPGVIGPSRAHRSSERGLRAPQAVPTRPHAPPIRALRSPAWSVGIRRRCPTV